MKKLGLILLGSAILLALVVGVFAHSNDTTAAKPEKKAKAMKTLAKKDTKTEKRAVEKKHYFTGEVTGIDAAANTITVEKKIGKKIKTMTFSAGEKVKLADIKKDSKVTVIYTKKGDKASASFVREHVVKKLASKKVTTKAEKKTEKKAAESAK